MHAYMVLAFLSFLKIRGCDLTLMMIIMQFECLMKRPTPRKFYATVRTAWLKRYQAMKFTPEQGNKKPVKAVEISGFEKISLAMSRYARCVAIYV